MSKPTEPFASLDAKELAKVSGGAARVAASASGSSSDQLTMMLQQIGQSIADLSKNNQSGMDPMTMMMMMMMMGGGGGGGGGGYPASYGAVGAAAQPTYVQVTADGSGYGSPFGGGGGGGCKGW